MSQNRHIATKQTTERSLLVRCLLAIAAIAGAAAWPDFADAACGDYVLVRDAQGRLIPASMVSGDHAAIDPASLPPSVPCHGPQCSRLPSVPPAAPLAPLRWLNPPEGSLTQLIDDPASVVGGGWLPTHLPTYPIHHPGHVFRPPRS